MAIRRRNRAPETDSVAGRRRDWQSSSSANLVAAPSRITLAKAAQELKGNTSRWLNEMSRFAWQEGYSAFSVSQSQRKTVVDYIDRQAEHHAKWSFEQEFLTLLKKSGIPYDPRFVLG